MTDEPEKLTDADPADLVHGLAFALRFDGGKRTHSGDEFMARLTAERLVKYLGESGYVVMKKPPAPDHTTHGGEKLLKDKADGIGIS